MSGHATAVLHDGEYRLGKLEPKRDPRTLRFSSIVPPKLPRPPGHFDHGKHVDAWPMYSNDALGDCTCAAAGHMVEAFTSRDGESPTQKPADADVLGLYWRTGAADDGRFCIDVLNSWRKDGLGPDKIAAYAQIYPLTRSSLELACWAFGGVYLGIALPRTIQQQLETWHVAHGAPGSDDAKPGSLGGHAVNAVGYDHRGLKLVTWGREIRATWGFVHRYVDEAYAVVSPGWVAGGKSPQGFDLAALEADVANL